MPRKPAKRQRIETRVQCEQCDASYTRPDKLAKHIARHHLATAPKEPDNEVLEPLVLYKPAEERLRPIHPSLLHFACSKDDCMLGQLIASMIPYECEHMEEQRNQQLQKWLDYVRANNRRSASLVLGD